MKKKIRTCFTCSDFVHHEHRWKWTAWICGRIQYMFKRSVAKPGYGYHEATMEALEELAKVQEKRSKMTQEEVILFELGIDRHEDGDKTIQKDSTGYYEAYVDIIERSGKREMILTCAYCCDRSPDPCMFRYDRVRDYIRGYQVIYIKWSCDRCLKNNPQPYDGCLYCGHPRKWRNC